MFIRPTILTIVALLLMSCGAVLAGWDDVEFDFAGYCWIIVNCFFTSSYVLYMRYASTSIKISRFGMVYYNSLLSTLILLPVCIYNKDYMILYDKEIFTAPFILWTTLAGIAGFTINLASLWCVGTTSATTYAVVGTFNKVPTVILGAILFRAKLTRDGILYILLGTAGALVFGYSKLA